MSNAVLDADTFPKFLINRYDPDADLFDYGAVFLAKQDHH